MESAIGLKSINEMKTAAAEKIDIYARQINEAFVNSDDGKLKISIAFDLCVSKETPGGIDIETTIGFVAEKIKDKTMATVVENQVEMPLADRVYRMEK
jgi:hypothetical protein